MHWLFGARRLTNLGILSMNRRNAECILDRNPRALFPIVDDKLRLRDLCRRINVPTPEVFRVIEFHAELRDLSRLLEGPGDFVVKPNRGSSGRGILVIVGRDRNAFLRHNGHRLGLDDLRQHVSEILAGNYSLGGRPDQALVQYRVRIHPALAPVSYKGIPDVRVLVYRGRPAMAMLRLPTRASNGRANLHQGGLGAGIDLSTGATQHAIGGDGERRTHPDTGAAIGGRLIPCWNDVLDLAQRVARAVGLGYLGVDIVIDAERGPMLLEANARPGLAIQLANAIGLRPRLEEIDRTSVSNPRLHLGPSDVGDS